jgi:hypothetical protein
MPNAIPGSPGKSMKITNKFWIFNPSRRAKFVWILKGARIHVRVQWRRAIDCTSWDDIMAACALISVLDGHIRRHTHLARHDAWVKADSLLDDGTQVGKSFYVGGASRRPVLRHLRAPPGAWLLRRGWLKARTGQMSMSKLHLLKVSGIERSNEKGHVTGRALASKNY